MNTQLFDFYLSLFIIATATRFLLGDLYDAMAETPQEKRAAAWHKAFLSTLLVASTVAVSIHNYQQDKEFFIDVIIGIVGSLVLFIVSYSLVLRGIQEQESVTSEIETKWGIKEKEKELIDKLAQISKEWEELKNELRSGRRAKTGKKKRNVNIT